MSSQVKLNKKDSIGDSKFKLVKYKPIILKSRKSKENTNSKLEDSIDESNLSKVKNKPIVKNTDDGNVRGKRKRKTKADALKDTENKVTLKNQKQKIKSKPQKSKPLKSQNTNKVAVSKAESRKSQTTIKSPQSKNKKSPKSVSMNNVAECKKMNTDQNKNDQDMPLLFQATPTKKKTLKDQKKELVENLMKLQDVNLSKPSKEKENGPVRGRGKKRQKSTRKNAKMKREKMAEQKTNESSSVSLTKKDTQKRTGRRCSVTGNWYIASGYLNDIISLLEDFENCDGWRFRDFAKCWCRKSFSLVYRGRQTFKELLEFAEEISLLTKRFIGPSHSTKRRIGALYTLYGLYYKFPVGHFFNICFELNEYKNLLELVHPFRSNIDNPDPAYILRKMELKGAIYHTATSYELCYDFHNEERDLVDLEYGKQKLAKSSAVNIAIPKFQLEADTELLNHYHSTKAKLTGNAEEIEPERALSLVSVNFLKSISNDLRDMRKSALNELGMMPTSILPLHKGLLGADEQVLDTVNQIICAEGEKNFDNTELDTYLQSVEGAVLSTVNQTDNAHLSRQNQENKQLLRNESLQNFMRPPTDEDLSQPLELIGAQKKKDINISLNMDDIQIPSSKSQNSGKIDLDVIEMDTGFVPLPLPKKKGRGRLRPAALLRAVGLKPTKIVKQEDTPTSPSIIKTLETQNEPSQNEVSTNQTSATSLPIKDAISPAKKSIKLSVELTFGELVKNVSLKMAFTAKQLRDIKKDRRKLLNFKKTLEPLIKKSLPHIDKDKLWLIQDIKMMDEVKVDKPLCFTNRFECLRQQASSDSEVESSDESVISEPPNIKKGDLDVDYIPPSLEEEQEELACEELQSEQLDDEYYSSEEENFFFSRKRRKIRKTNLNYYFMEKGELDSDKLIRPKEKSLSSMKMAPINIGGKVRYFPVSGKGTESEKENCDVIPDEFSALIPDEFSTWNDYSFSSCPSLTKINHRRKGGGDYFNFLYPATSLIKDKMKENSNEQDPLYFPKIMNRRNLASIATSKSKRKIVGEFTDCIDNLFSTRLRKRKSLNKFNVDGDDIVKSQETNGNEHSNRPDESTPPPESKISSPKVRNLAKNNNSPTKVKKEMCHIEELEEDWDEEIQDEVDTLSDDEINVFQEENLYQSKVDDQTFSPRKRLRKGQVYSEEHSLMSEEESFTTDEHVSVSVGLLNESDHQENTITRAHHTDTLIQNVNEESVDNSFVQCLNPGTIIIDEDIGQDQSKAESPSDSILYDASKSILFCKVKSVDGNEVFMPVSSYQQLESSGIQILSFDRAELNLNASPSVDSNSSTTKVSNFSQAQEELTVQQSPIGLSYISVSPSNLQGPREVPVLDYVGLNQESSPIPKKLSDLNRPPKKDAKKCSFFFSPKLTNLTKSKQTASGKPPSTQIEKPRVKFVMKGICKVKK